MFFFYRVFDSLRLFISELYGLTKEKEQWEKLRVVTATDRIDIEFIKTFADPVRHGGETFYNLEEIEKAERLAWKAIHDVLLHYKERGYK